MFIKNEIIISIFFILILPLRVHSKTHEVMKFENAIKDLDNYIDGFEEESCEDWVNIGFAIAIGVLTIASTVVTGGASLIVAAGASTIAQPILAKLAEKFCKWLSSDSRYFSAIVACHQSTMLQSQGQCPNKVLNIQTTDINFCTSYYREECMFQIIYDEASKGHEKEVDSFIKYVSKFESSTSKYTKLDKELVERFNKDVKQSTLVQAFANGMLEIKKQMKIQQDQVKALQKANEWMTNWIIDNDPPTDEGLMGSLPQLFL